MINLVLIYSSQQWQYLHIDPLLKKYSKFNHKFIHYTDDLCLSKGSYFSHCDNSILYSNKLLHKLKIRLLLFSSFFYFVKIVYIKPTPYLGMSAISNRIRKLYYGDGFGVYPNDGRIWWMPNQFTERKNLIFNLESTNNSDICSLYNEQNKFKCSNFHVQANIKNRLWNRVKRTQLKSIFQELELAYNAYLFLNNLTANRIDSHNILNLLDGFVTRNFDQVSKVLIIPHPANASLLTQLINCKNTNHYFDILQRDQFHSFIAEEFAAYLNYTKSSSTLCLYQTGVIPIRRMFPRLNISFGWGVDLIQKYYKSDYLVSQLNFESKISNYLEENNYGSNSNISYLC